MGCVISPLVTLLVMIGVMAQDKTAESCFCWGMCSTVCFRQQNPGIILPHLIFFHLLSYSLPSFRNCLNWFKWTIHAVESWLQNINDNDKVWSWKQRMSFTSWISWLREQSWEFLEIEMVTWSFTNWREHWLFLLFIPITCLLNYQVKYLVVSWVWSSRVGSGLKIQI